MFVVSLFQKNNCTDWDEKKPPIVPPLPCIVDATDLIDIKYWDPSTNKLVSKSEREKIDFGEKHERDGRYDRDEDDVKSA